MLASKDIKCLLTSTPYNAEGKPTVNIFIPSSAIRCATIFGINAPGLAFHGNKIVVFSPANSLNHFAIHLLPKVYEREINPVALRVVSLFLLRFEKSDYKMRS